MQASGNCYGGRDDAEPLQTHMMLGSLWKIYGIVLSYYWPWISSHRMAVGQNAIKLKDSACHNVLEYSCSFISLLDSPSFSIPICLMSFILVSTLRRFFVALLIGKRTPFFCVMSFQWIINASCPYIYLSTAEHSVVNHSTHTKKRSLSGIRRVFLRIKWKANHNWWKYIWIAHHK